MVVLQNAVEGRVSVTQADEALQRSPRQIERLKQRLKPGDAAWVQRGNLGRSPVNCVSEETRKRVRELAGGKYSGFNDNHLRYKLAAEENLKLSRSTVRRIFAPSGREVAAEAAAVQISQPPAPPYSGGHALAGGC